MHQNKFTLTLWNYKRIKQMTSEECVNRNINRTAAMLILSSGSPSNNKHAIK